MFVVIVSYLVCFSVVFLGQSGDDFKEVQQFVARFSEIKDFEVTDHGRDGVVTQTFWQSDGGYVTATREKSGENREIERRGIFNPNYMANLENRGEQWILSSFYDGESKDYKTYNGRDRFLISIFGPLIPELLNPENIKKVVRNSPGEVEYYVSPESEFFIPISGCDRVTVKYAEIDNEFLPISIEYWIGFGQNKAAKQLITVRYSTPGLLPIEAESLLSQVELGINDSVRSKISLINPDNFRSEKDCYLSGYGLGEPKGLSRRLSWTAWLWIFIAIVIASKLVWHRFLQKK
jgi:hypothetical protein